MWALYSTRISPATAARRRRRSGRENSVETSDSDVQVFPAFTDVLMIVTLVLVFYLFSLTLTIGQSNGIIVRCQRELRAAVEKNVPAYLLANMQISEDGSMQ